MRVSTSSRPARTLGAGTIALSVGLGLLTGLLDTPQSASAATRSPAVTTTQVFSQTSVPFSQSGLTLKAVASQSKAAVSRAAANRIMIEAAKHKGKLYKFGAAGPKRFDCSGYTMYVYKKAAGKKLPHKANLQQRYGKAIAKSRARPGDLIIIRDGSYGTHAGIYAGGGMMWAAPRAGKTVTKQKIWSRNYVVRRLV
ncbi:NlpC-likelipoprotein [Actinoplanes sp. SE50]|nr:NlpC-like probable lipoprotein [Actinoplanes sp. SE50/110]ATO85537.1 NlpC-likelipoprotein [Actinoplanes sp. SE50]SLM02950.1 putative endopeptidase p60 precursor [Actinoplanes sp. SE50/110]